jgi:hypothetical protein
MTEKCPCGWRVTKEEQSLCSKFQRYLTQPAWWLPATVHVPVSGFRTFPEHLYLLSPTSDKELGPKQIASVEVDDNMARNDASPDSNNEEIKLIIDQKCLPLHFARWRKGTWKVSEGFHEAPPALQPIRRRGGTDRSICKWCRSHLLQWLIQPGQHCVKCRTCGKLRHSALCTLCRELG